MTSKTKGQSGQAKAAFWHHHIEEYNRSSLSQVAYCHTNSLALSTFQHWKKKLTSYKPQELARFYPLTVQPAAPQPKNRQKPSSGLSLYLGDEFRIELKEDFSAPALKKLIKTLGQS